MSNMIDRALVSVGTQDLPEPSTYSGTSSTLVDSGRNALGGFIGAVIREDVAKVSLSWRYLTADQWAGINRLFKASTGGGYVNDVTFFDQSMGDWVTEAMYVSDRQAGAWRRDPDTGELLGFRDCKLTLTQV